MLLHGKNKDLFVILCLVIIVFVSNVCETLGASTGITTGLTEMNPNYRATSRRKKKISFQTLNDESDKNDSDDGDSSSDSESESEAESDYDEDISEEEDEEDETGTSQKGRINKALAKSNSKVVTFFKNHRAEITVILVIFAFRYEIWSIISRIITESDNNNGRRLKRISPTSIIKIVLFLDLMRKVLHNGDDSLLPGSMNSSLLNNFFRDYLGSSSITKNTAFLPPVEQHYTFERINERYTKDTMAFKKALNSHQTQHSNKSKGRPLFAVSASSNGSSNKDYSDKNKISSYNSTSIILELKNLDTSVSNMDTLRDKVSYILSQHRTNIDDSNHDIALNETVEIEHQNQTLSKHKVTNMEVIILLESPGGSASDYGLAAEQIGRLRKEPGINVTICVDKVAASGGYMIAVMSSPGKLFAAPFSIVGSIGVIGQAVNIHNTLQNWGVRPLVFRGGKDKAPVGLVGEVTKDGIAKVQEMVDKTHTAFKRHVISGRPNLRHTIDKLATGDVWLGHDALEVGLVDRIVSSDEYIGERMQEGALVLKLIKYQKPRFFWGSGLSRSGGFPGATLGLNSIFETADEMKVLLRKFINILDGKSEGSEHYSTILAKAI